MQNSFSVRVSADGEICQAVVDRSERLPAELNHEGHRGVHLVRFEVEVDAVLARLGLVALLQQETEAAGQLRPAEA